MKWIFFYLMTAFFSMACSSCYSCSFQYFLTEEDKINNTNIINFTTDKNCDASFRQRMEALFLAEPFAVQDSFKCRKLRG